MTRDFDRIASRLTDYFTRQVAWLEADLERVRPFETQDDDPDLDSTLQSQRDQMKQGAALEKEFWALKKEWDADASASDAERDAVAKLAEKAEALALELAAALDRCKNRTDMQSAEVAKAMASIRKGKDVAGKFRPDWPTEGSFIDHSG